MDSCIELNEELARMDKELKTSTLYVTKVSFAMHYRSITYNSQYIMDKLFPVLAYMLFYKSHLCTTYEQHHTEI